MAGQPKWSFLPLPTGAKARDPMQDEFFQDQSIDGIDHALVRETIQNSLDARANGAPAKVVFSLGKLSAERTSYWFPEDVQAHFSAKEIRFSSLPNWEKENCAYLTIEDFGTKGLEGKIDSFDPVEGGNFYHFFRAEGVSNKKEGDRGSWGVGKIVIPRSSRVRSFFAITRRASGPGMHLMGQTILRHHEVDGVRYTPDGWFSRDQEGLQVPYTDDETTSRLIDDFCLVRMDEPGLGLVIPWIYEKYLTFERLRSVIAREYFIPILGGQLVIELRDHETGACQRFDARSFADLKLLASEDDQFQDTVQLAGNLLRLDKIEPLVVDVVKELNENDVCYDWGSYKTALPPQDIESALEQGRILHFRVPIVIKPALGIADTGVFDVLVKRKSGRHYPVYVRDGLIIPNQPTRKRTPDCVVLIHASNSVVSDALRRSECPAHTDWKYTRDKFQEQKYSLSNKLIPFVRDSALKLLEKLFVQEGKSDYNLLAALLPLPFDGGSLQDLQGAGHGLRRKEKEILSQTDNVGLLNIPTPAPRCWTLRQSKGEIRLAGNPDGFVTDKGYILTLSAAYDLHGRNPFKAHSKFDFDLLKAAKNGVDEKSNFQVAINKHATIKSGGYGTLIVHVSDPSFEMVFCPADLNRDLIMKVGSVAVEQISGDDEEIDI
ncbi:hypothetical protein [Pseudomonas cichorii]|uniref:Uncharacterized protein n=1 Tax=Pseudomonas cichorii TaxID=36746 RepID=A0ABQ1DJE1_PSECI|nr:hypothetical protein [Pseudomonas cichorii]AHF69009.1 hypothetical protein PCH70_38560 [Pseudomonas cichorii JBC1]QVE15987.1 hypothetical protein KGD89_19180 [Pseudomonas cichorii]GFM91116.1 hypothetical protein PSCICP_10880 [Pseudomonas cichorii]SDN23152.1 hypothetical protein SAMN05216599_101328 [Pseudomonas cichorii]